jgi:hypothetical protein
MSRFLQKQTVVVPQFAKQRRVVRVADRSCYVAVADRSCCCVERVADRSYPGAGSDQWRTVVRPGPGWVGRGRCRLGTMVASLPVRRRPSLPGKVPGGGAFPFWWSIAVTSFPGGKVHQGVHSFAFQCASSETSFGPAGLS